MARVLQPHFQESAMATRMKMLKLLQEVRGHAQFTSLRLPARPPGAMLLQVQSVRFRGANAPRRKTITILMRGTPDIPAPVTIRHVQVAVQPERPRPSK